MSANPWVPFLEGKILPPCRWYDEVVAAGSVPKDESWGRRFVMPTLEGAADPVAIWEAVLAIWRLIACEESGAEDPVWGKHVRAWLVGNNCLSSTSLFISLVDPLRSVD
jgi:hypothetical protein